MLQLAKRVGVCGLTLIFILTLLPLSVFRAEATENDIGTMVESTLDFHAMTSIAEGNNAEEKAASKASAKQVLLNAGAVDADNLFLKGNLETIVNPGGYNGPGYFIQKAEAVSGETIQNATLSLDYWVCTANPQGYLEVYASADNQSYEKVFEQREGNGDPYSYSTRQSASVPLPVSEGQTVIYIKVVMEHWSTYEGSAVSCSTITLNRDPRQYEPVDTDKTPEECTMVTQTHSFNSLTTGEVSAEDIGAVEELNLFFGIDDVPLLSPRNGYEIASATWKLEAAEGEPLNDCVLTIVGRTAYLVESVKADHYLKVYASTDGKTYTQVHEFRANDNMDDTQRLTVDLTEVVAGYAQAYVKLEWLIFDSPHLFGIRSVTLTGNTAGVDSSGGGSGKMVVSNVHAFTALPVGDVDAAAIDAYKSANLMFGCNKAALLTAREAGEDAYATWKLTAPEGETFEDCYLTLIGKVGYVHADRKDTTSLTVFLSTDGEKYSEVKKLVPEENASDSQQYVMDLSAQAYGLSELYVKIYWSTEDDPSCMGLQAMALVANAGEDYPLFTPVPENRVITDEEMAGLNGGAADNTEGTVPGGNAAGSQENPSAGWILWVVVAVVVAVAGGIAAWIVIRRKKTETSDGGKAE